MSESEERISSRFCFYLSLPLLQIATLHIFPVIVYKHLQIAVHLQPPFNKVQTPPPPSKEPAFASAQDFVLRSDTIHQSAERGCMCDMCDDACTFFCPHQRVLSIQGNKDP
jgi:hypothetical protein